MLLQRYSNPYGFIETGYFKKTKIDIFIDVSLYYWEEDEALLKIAVDLVFK